MTPKDKHTEVAWQAKQREVKTGSVEKTVHSATSAIYTASEIRSVMSHSETQEITGNHITREQHAFPANCSKTSALFFQFHRVPAIIFVILDIQLILSHII